MHVDKDNEKAKWEVRDCFINFIDFLNLIIKEFEDFLFTAAFSCKSLSFLWVTDRERFHFPSVLHAHDQLDLSLEYEADLKTLTTSWSDLELEVKLLELTEVLLQILLFLTGAAIWNALQIFLRGLR